MEQQQLNDEAKLAVKKNPEMRNEEGDKEKNANYEDINETTGGGSGDEATGGDKANEQQSMETIDSPVTPVHNGNKPQQHRFAHHPPPPLAEIEASIDDIYYNKLPHWSQNIALCQSIPNSECRISGGSDLGQLPFFADTGDIILEIDEIAVSGLTSADIASILDRELSHSFKIVTNVHGLPLELREYLSRRFTRASLDHKLQEVIRENIYSRTIPCTTRPPRTGEVDGVDYRFLSREQFFEMERSGQLLESGVYCNHYYGTPLPLNKSTSENTVNSSGTTSNTSSSAKRRRNRSNIVAIDAASLPYGWERISDAHYGVYYIDHINKRTQYERPYEIELVKTISGFGFTLVEVDKGLVIVKSLIVGGAAEASGVIQSGDILVSVNGISVSTIQYSDVAQLFSNFNVADRVRLTFARGYQLPVGFNDEDYDIITLKIVKGAQGFGFTISEGHNGQKVKKILDLNRCCSLRQGDILLSINGIDLTTMTHLSVVETLKQCTLDQATEFMIKRKKRFRSKTPTQPEESTTMLPMRNCKTPNSELFYNKDNCVLDPRVEGTVDINGNGYQSTRNPPEYVNSQLIAPCDALNNNSLYTNQVEYQYQPKSSPQYGTIAGAKVANIDPNDPMFANNFDIDYEYYQVKLNRTESGFGFRIIGGSEEGSNVAIGSIVIGGSAFKDGALKAGDEIVSINEASVLGASHQDVVQLMSHTGPTVVIVVRRKRYLNAYDVTLYRQDYEGFGFVIISCGNCALIGRIIEASPAHRCQRLHIRDRIIAVNGADVTTLSHPEIVNKIKESGETLHLRIIPADCYTVELIRGPSGYGFSIRGGVEFNGMPLFILCIAPNGPAAALLQIGDEILEINDISTVGMAHSDAVRLISQSGPMVKLRLRHNFGNNDLLNAGPSPLDLQQQQQQQQSPLTPQMSPMMTTTTTFTHPATTRQSPTPLTKFIPNIIHY